MTPGLLLILLGVLAAPLVQVIVADAGEPLPFLPPPPRPPVPGLPSASR